MKWKKRKEKNILDKIDKEKFIDDRSFDMVPLSLISALPIKTWVLASDEMPNELIPNASTY